MVQVCNESYECKVSAKRMWHALFKDGHNCLPKALPFKVLAVEYPHGQHGFELPGAERVIKFHNIISNEIHKAQEYLHGEEARAKEVAVKVDVALHKEALLVKEKAEEVGGATHKESQLVKEKVDKVGDATHKEAQLIKEKVEQVGDATHKEGCFVKEKVEGVGELAYKGIHLIKEEVSNVPHHGVQFIEKEVGIASHEAAQIREKVHHKEAEEAYKAIETAEKLLHKEEKFVGGAFHKLGELIQHEDVWIKEKIEEVDHEAFKITISLLVGGLIGILFKHYKHRLEIKDTSHLGVHGSILHWTSEYETLTSTIHLLHSLDEITKHVLGTFHSVEAYLLNHDDYAT